MQARDASGRSVLPRSRKTRALLAVLALAGPRRVLRSELTALLWSRREHEQGRASLRQSVHELRVSLGPRAGILLQTDRNHLLLLDDRLWMDVRVLTAATVSRPEGLELLSSRKSRSGRCHVGPEVFVRPPVPANSVPSILAGEITAALSRFRWISCALGALALGLFQRALLADLTGWIPRWIIGWTTSAGA
jgi:hypothetical protein